MRTAEEKTLPGARSAPFIHKVLLLFTGTVVGQSIVIAASPVITRLYDPVEFGFYAAYLSIFSWILPASGLRYEFASTLPKHEAEAYALLVSACASSVVVATGVGLTLFLAGTIGEVEGFGSPAIVSLIMATGLVLGSVSRATSTWLLARAGLVGIIARNRTYQTVGQTIPQIGMGLAQFGFLGLILGHATGQFVGAVRLIQIAWKQRLPFDWTTVRTMAKKYASFSFVSTASTTINGAGLNLPSIVIGILFGPAALGYYALSNRVVGTPMTVIGTSVAQAYLAECSSLHRLDRHSDCLRLFRRTAATLAVLGVAPLSILVLFAPWVFAFVFGSDWADAASATRALGALYATRFVMAPLGQTLSIVRAERLQLGWDLFRLVLAVGALLAAATMDLTFLQSLVWYSMAGVFCYALLFLIVDRRLRALARSRSMEQLLA